MFLVCASFTSLLEAVVRRVGSVSVSHVREICEVGSLCLGIEVHIPFNSPGGCSVNRIFWDCHLDACLDPLNSVALQAIVFLQSLYGFTVLDYGYGEMMRCRLLFSSALEAASSIVVVCHESVNQVL